MGTNVMIQKIINFISQEMCRLLKMNHISKKKNHLDTQGQPIILFPNSFIFPEETYQEQVAHDEAEPLHEPGASSSGGENESNEEHAQEAITVRRSIRETQPPIRLRDYVSHQVMYPIQDFLSYNNISTEYQAYLSQITK
jgi:hypothetical protein